MPKTFFEKVWDEHVIADLGDSTALLQIDRLVLHEMSGSVAIRQLEESGRQPAMPELVFTVIDHVIDTVPGLSLSCEAGEGDPRAARVGEGIFAGAASALTASTGAAPPAAATGSITTATFWSLR